MGKYSSDSDHSDYSYKKRLGRLRHRSSSSNSSGSSYHRRHKKKSNRNRSRTRKRSRSRIHHRRRSRSYSVSRTHRHSRNKRSDSNSRDNHSRSRSRDRSRSNRDNRSRSYERSKSDDRYSKSKSQSSRSKSKDKFGRNRSRSRSSEKHISIRKSNSPRNSKCNSKKSDKNCLDDSPPRYENVKNKLSAADPKIENKLGQHLSASSTDNFYDVTIDLENESSSDLNSADKFLQFSSAAKKIPDNIVIDLKSQTILVPKVEIKEKKLSIFHPNLMPNEETRIDKWVKDLFAFRQKALRDLMKS